MQKKSDKTQIVTKQDILRLEQSTKSDILRLEQSTKSNIQKLERSMRKFSTKTELKRVEKVVRSEILRVEERVENIEDGQKRMETTLNKISNQLDGFVGKVDNLTVDNEIGANQTHELRKDVDSHEKRIAKIESSISS